MLRLRETLQPHWFPTAGASQKKPGYEIRAKGGFAQGETATGLLGSRFPGSAIS